MLARLRSAKKPCRKAATRRMFASLRFSPAKAGVEKVLRDPVTAMEALTEHSKSIPSDVKYAMRPFVVWAQFVRRLGETISQQQRSQLKELVHGNSFNTN